MMSVITWFAPARESMPAAYAKPAGWFATKWRDVRGFAGAIVARRDWLLLVITALALLVIGAVVGIFFSPAFHRTDSTSFLLAAPGLFVAVGLIFAGWLRFSRRAGVSARLRGWRLVAAGFLGGTVAIAALVAWDLGWIASLQVAAGLAVAIALLIPLSISRSAD